MIDVSSFSLILHRSPKIILFENFLSVDFHRILRVFDSGQCTGRFSLSVFHSLSWYFTGQRISVECCNLIICFMSIFVWSSFRRLKSTENSFCKDCHNTWTLLIPKNSINSFQFNSFNLQIYFCNSKAFLMDFLLIHLQNYWKLKLGWFSHKYFRLNEILFLLNKWLGIFQIK